MHWFERTCIAVRHAPGLKKAGWLWDRLRPAYRKCVNRWWGQQGLPRNFNGTDPLKLDPQFAGHSEVYEPEVWPRAMSFAKPGAQIADVGANIGIYALAWAKRVGESGKVWAFEPDPKNLAILKRHVELNGTAKNTEVRGEALGSKEARLAFSLSGPMSSIQSIATKSGDVIEVQQTTLDNILGSEKLDVLKIDVEGYEEEVLKGATKILSDPARKPAAIFIEIHPYAWKALGTTSDSLKLLVTNAGYRLEMMNGKEVGELDFWGEILALKV